MRLTDLRGARVRRQDGGIEGVIWEIHCQDGQVTALGIGSVTLFERMAGRGKGRRIPWSEVVRVKDREVVVGTAAKAKRS